MKEDKTATKISSGKENEPVVENGKKKGKEERPATKVVVRRLPPSMTEDQFKLQVSPLPEIDYLYFVSADMSLMPNAFSRAYINFVDQSDLFIFTQKFDGYVFVDSKGGEFPAVVEFAPFQRIPRNRPSRKKDPKVGTIESDPIFIAFKERLETEIIENRSAVNASKQHFFETSLITEKKEMNNTPLLDYIKKKREERQRIREEKREEKRKKDLERRRAKEEQRRTKKDEDNSVLKTPSPSPDQSIPEPFEKSPNLLQTNTCSKKEKMEDLGSIMKKNEKDNGPFNTKYQEREVSKKVRELVHFFNKSLSDSNDKLSQNDVCITIPNCTNHRDLEIELIKNTSDKSINKYSTRSTSELVSDKFDNYKMPGFDAHFNQSNSKYKNSSKRPILGSQGNVPILVSRPHLYAHPHSDIIMKPVKISSLLQNIKREGDVKLNDVNKSQAKPNFPADTFRKNLQKVVADVLGNSKVACPKESTINKPRTFVRRVSSGSGELCARSGFNSPNFYLPPRAYGCGPGETTVILKKDDKINNDRSSKPIKRHFSTFCKSTLPPFSKKSITSSKSDGDIEKTENVSKVGGSQESLKIRNEARDVEGKHHLFRRPFVTPKKSVILERFSKVSL